MIYDNEKLSAECIRLRELISEIGLPLRRLPEVISQKPEQCLTWWSQAGSVQITNKHLGQLARLVGINEDLLMDGSYDRTLARRRVMGDYNSLPDQYLENPNSFLRTSEHIYRYIILTRGQVFADQVLTSLNVSPLIYENASQLINLTYFADLLNALSQRGFSQNELDTLASVIFLSLKETPLGMRFEESESFHDVYSLLAQNFSYFDSNFEYKSEFVGKKYILKTTLPLDQHRGLRNNPESLQRLMRYRHILLAWFPHLAGMTPLFPKAEILHKSDFVEVRYELTLEKNPKPQKPLPCI